MSLNFDHFERSVQFHLEARNLAFLDVPFPLYTDTDEQGKVIARGPAVVHLTIKRLLWLHYNNNAIYFGNETEENWKHSTLMFLFICSEGFEKITQDLFEAWTKTVGEIDLPRCRLAISEYILNQVVNSSGYQYQQPKISSDPEDGEEPEIDEFQRVQLALEPLKNDHFAAVYYDLFKSAYDWDEERIFNTPLPKLHLLEKRIVRRHSNDAAPTNDADTYNNAYLESLKE